MEDGTGRRIDFKNTLIILTTNAGTDLIIGGCRVIRSTVTSRKNLRK